MMSGFLKKGSEVRRTISSLQNSINSYDPQSPPKKLNLSDFSFPHSASHSLSPSQLRDLEKFLKNRKNMLNFVHSNRKREEKHRRDILKLTFGKYLVDNNLLPNLPKEGVDDIPKIGLNLTRIGGALGQIEQITSDFGLFQVPTNKSLQIALSYALYSRNRNDYQLALKIQYFPGITEDDSNIQNELDKETDADTDESPLINMIHSYFIDHEEIPLEEDIEYSQSIDESPQILETFQKKNSTLNFEKSMDKMSLEIKRALNNLKTNYLDYIILQVPMNLKMKPKHFYEEFHKIIIIMETLKKTNIIRSYGIQAEKFSLGKQTVARSRRRRGGDFNPQIRGEEVDEIVVDLKECLKISEEISRALCDSSNEFFESGLKIIELPINILEVDNLEVAEYAKSNGLHVMSCRTLTHRTKDGDWKPLALCQFPFTFDKIFRSVRQKILSALVETGNNDQLLEFILVQLDDLRVKLETFECIEEVDWFLRKKSLFLRPIKSYFPPGDMIHSWLPDLISLSRQYSIFLMTLGLIHDLKKGKNNNYKNMKYQSRNSELLNFQNLRIPLSKFNYRPPRFDIFETKDSETRNSFEDPNEKDNKMSLYEKAIRFALEEPTVDSVMLGLPTVTHRNEFKRVLKLFYDEKGSTQNIDERTKSDRFVKKMTETPEMAKHIFSLLHPDSIEEFDGSDYNHRRNSLNQLGQLQIATNFDQDFYDHDDYQKDLTQLPSFKQSLLQ